MESFTALGIVLFSVVCIASIAMLVINAYDFIENKKLIKEIRLKIKELKIKEIELNH